VTVGKSVSAPEGARICFIVRRANPLFYSYSVGTSAVTVAQPAGLADLLKQISSGITKMGGAMAFLAEGTRVPELAAAGSVDIQYATDEKKLLADLDNIEAQRQQSLNEDSIWALAPKVDAIGQSAKSWSAQMTAKYESQLKDPTNAGDVVLSQLVFLHHALDSLIAARVAEFDAASVKARELTGIQTPLCSTPLKTDRIKVALIIKSSLPKEKDHRQQSKDTAATVLADPIATDAFEIGAGGLLSVDLSYSKFG
jgi:hypothetical protein